jgi:hypothetical protein
MASASQLISAINALATEHNETRVRIHVRNIVDGVRVLDERIQQLESRLASLEARR